MENQVRDENHEIGWMLQSTQISGPALIEALAQAHAGEIFQLASLWCILRGRPNNQQETILVVSKALARAVVLRRRFWGGVSQRAWLFKFACEQLGIHDRRKAALNAPRCWIFETRSKGERIAQLAMLLRSAFGFSISEIAYLLDTNQQDTARLLAAGYLALAEGSTDPSVGHDLDAIANSLLAREPVKQFEHHAGPEEVPFFTDVKNFRVEPMEWIRRTDDEFNASLLEPATLPDPEQVAQIVEETHKQVFAEKSRLRMASAAKQVTLLALFLVMIAWLLRPGSILTKNPDPTLQPTATPITLGSPTPVPDDMFYFIYQIQPGDTVNSIAENVGITAQTVAKFNSISVETTLDPAISLSLPFLISLPENRPELSDPPLPLTDQSTVEQILSRMTDSNQYWQSIWATIHSLSYGAAGYFGPPVFSSYTQAWVRQSSIWLLAQGYSDEGMFYTDLHTDQMRFTRMGKNSPVFGVFQEEQQEFPGWLLVNPRQWKSEELSILGNDTIAGRAAISLERQAGLDAAYLERIWVDAETGLVLCYQRIDSKNNMVILSETIVTEIVYNIETTAETFVTGLTKLDWFAGNYLAIPLPVDQVPPSFDWTETVVQRAHAACDPPVRPFDYARDPVLLAWPLPGFQDSQCESSQDPEENGSGISMFTGGSYLGSIRFEGNLNQDLVFQSCSRSPDGRLVALLVRNALYQAGSTSLYWIDLREPLQAKLVSSSGSMGRLALYAPDSHRMAFSDCKQNQCGITIYDTETGEEVFFPVGENTFVMNFEWSPDGQVLGLIVNTFFQEIGPGSLSYSLKVIDSGTGDELSSSPLSQAEWEAGVLPSGSPQVPWMYFLLRSNEGGCLLP